MGNGADHPRSSFEHGDPAMSEHRTPDIVFRPPHDHEGLAVHELVAGSPPLDVNSEYCYLLLCSHFADTCTVAERDGRLIGIQTGYREPNAPDTLFVWQIAVSPEGRGLGIGRGMVEHLLSRFSDGSIRYLEQTVTKSNTASRALFESVARRYDTEVNESLLFGDAHFAAGTHEAEYLLRIGPFRQASPLTTTSANNNQGVT